MKFAIYGVSRSGKDYFINDLVQYFLARGANLYHVKGSETLNKIAIENYGVKFNQCAEREKRYLRKKLNEFVNEMEIKYGHVVVDGHYSFFNEQKTLFSVCEESDIQCYDKFFYLDSVPEQIVQRMRNSLCDKYNDTLDTEDIKRWIEYEIEHLTERLLNHDKELHVIRYNDENALRYVFDCITKDKFNSRLIAASLVEELKFDSECVILTDCDKTLSYEDSSNLAFEYLKLTKNELKEIFNGDRYSNFQMSQANACIDRINLFTADSMDYVVDKINGNQNLIDNLLKLSEFPIVGITAGKGELWTRIVRKFGLNVTVLSHEDMLVSKYVKYFVVKELQARGVYVIAIGDSLLDGLMLRQANKGYIITAKGHRENIANFLTKNQSIKQLDYLPHCYSGIGVEKEISFIKTVPINQNVSANIDVCKSNSGTMGKILRRSHYELGQEIAKTIRCDYENTKFVVVALLRAGLPFSLGIADYFDCPILFYDSGQSELFIKQLNDNGQLRDYTFIICDAVINSGKTIEKVIADIGKRRCIIATNVLSHKFCKVLKYPIYAGRISTNSFVGAKQKNISNGKGPDTGDRLYSLINA